MNIDDIVKSLKILTDHERASYAVVYSAALVLCGADIDARNINLQARSDEEFTRLFIEREKVPMVHPEGVVPAIDLSENVNAFYDEDGNRRLVLQPFGERDLMFKETQGIIHLSPLGCMRWYQLALEYSNTAKNHYMMATAMQLYHRQTAISAREIIDIVATD